MFVDFHCDVLMKMLSEPDIRFADDPRLDVTLKRLKDANMLLQNFAIYIPERVSPPSIVHVFECIRLFHARIASSEDVLFVRTAGDLARARNAGKIGAMLSLEGADALQGRLEDVDLLYAMGVRSLQMTWNYGNWAADGVLEPRRAGLTVKGRQLVERCSQLGMLLDVSHLNEPGFWEAAALYNRPLIASHANAHAVCPHPRNLGDEQIRAIIATGGLIGIAFVPDFIDPHHPDMNRLLRHIEHVCSLGGESNLMLGSDFDGIDRHVPGLEHPGRLPALAELLMRHFPQRTVDGILRENAFRFLLQQLPS
jgi:membrane dipeptidase